MSDENDFAQLKALQEHRRSMSESVLIAVEESDDHTILTAGGYELVIMKDDVVRPIRFSGVSIRTMDNLLACHALLQRAKEILGGGA